MVKFMLMIMADLENLQNLRPQDGCDDPNFLYYFKVKCGECNEVRKNSCCVSLSSTVPLPNGKGSTNLIQKCKFCGKSATVTMLPGHGKPLSHEASEAGIFTPMMLFDCRGCEPLDFQFGSGWKVESIAGTVFEKVDLSEDFVEYDESGTYPVMISIPSSKFIVVK